MSGNPPASPVASPALRKRYRAAVLGCGWIGASEAMNYPEVGIQSHAEAYARHSRSELSAVVDADLDRANTAARRWHAEKSYHQAEAMLTEIRPELASICTPDADHAATLRLVLECPSIRGVLAEKPLALDVDEAADLSALARSKGVVLAVNYSRRFCPPYASLRRLIQSGGLGRIQQVTGYYGKGLVHNGTHWLDLLLFFFGPFRRAKAYSSLAAGLDTPSVLIELEAGFSAMLHASDTRAFTIFEMDILGERGRVRLIDNGQVIEFHEAAPSRYYAGYQNLTLKKVRSRCLKHAMVLAVNDLIACVEKRKTAPACTAEDAINALYAARLAMSSLSSPTTPA